MTIEQVNFILGCVAVITTAIFLSLLVIRRTAWINSRRFDALIVLFVAITIALLSVIFFGGS